jgi:hypothetical protein
LGVDFRDETVCLVPKLINEALDATGAELQGQLVTIMNKVNLMTTALDFVYGIELNERNHRVIVYHLPRGVTQRDVEYVRDSLIVYRQHELYIRFVRNSLKVCIVVLQETDGRNREDRNGVLPDLQHPPARPDRPPPRGQAQNRNSCQSSLCEFSRLVGVACSLRSTRFSPTS